MNRIDVETILAQVEQLLATAGTLPTEVEQAAGKLLNDDALGSTSLSPRHSGRARWGPRNRFSISSNDRFRYASPNPELPHSRPLPLVPPSGVPGCRFCQQLAQYTDQQCKDVLARGINELRTDRGWEQIKSMAASDTIRRVRVTHPTMFSHPHSECCRVYTCHRPRFGCRQC